MPSKTDFERAAGMPVTMECYPDEEALKQRAEDRYPYVDWTARGTLDVQDVRQAHRSALAAVQLTNDKGEPKVPRNHSDFATVVAARPWLLLATIT